MSLLTLPPELIEAVIVSSRSPRTVTNLARTCRALHALVYASPDTHLWRELFLATWDDPRGALAHRAAIDPRVIISLGIRRHHRRRPASAASNRDLDVEEDCGSDSDSDREEEGDSSSDWDWDWDLDWGGEYRRRVAADRYLKAWRRDVCLAGDAGGAMDSTTSSDDVDVTTTTTTTTTTTLRDATFSSMSVLLYTMLTLAPFPASPPIALTVLTPSGPQVPSNPHASTDAGAAGVGVPRREHLTSAPPLPPLLIVLASGFSAFQPSTGAVRLGRAVYGPHATRARTTTPTLIIPTPSLPPQLVRTLLASHVVSVRGFPAHEPGLSAAGESREDALADLFHRTVCITGFVPVPSPLGFTESVAADECDPPHSHSHEGEEGKDGEQCEQCGQSQGESDGRPTREVFPTPAQQHADARMLARRRVYDMRYLRGDRMWGPYQSVTRASVAARPVRRGVDRTDVEGQGERVTGRRGSASRRASNAQHLGTLAWAMGMDVDPDEVNSSSDHGVDGEDDGEWREPASSSSAVAGPEPPADEEMEPLEAEQHPLIAHMLGLTEYAADASTTPAAAASNEASSPSSSRRRTRRSKPRMPPAVPPREIRAEHLRPDYTYLASVRIVVEANLRELFDRGAIKTNVEDTPSEDRPGGVGLFWEDEDELMLARDGSAGTATDADADVTAFTTTTTTTTTGSDAGAMAFDLVDILNRFRNLEVARLGSSCGYWNGWIERQKRGESMEGTVEDASASESSSGVVDISAMKPRIVSRRDELEHSTIIEDRGKGKGKEKGKERDGGSIVAPALPTGGELGDWEVGPEGEECEGWDWAGVTGIWRRCVCWMDYRELLFFNLDPSKFLTLETQEACRIIPMELRITGYTRAGLMPMHDLELERSAINVLGSHLHKHPRWGYFRPPPVIHFTGSSIGSDRSPDEGRIVKGSVQLIGGGEVRWRMDTYAQGIGSSPSSSPEWSSEALQIGGVGSALGLLGMWTGAEHERADPLGPFWAWRVA